MILSAFCGTAGAVEFWEMGPSATRTAPPRTPSPCWRRIWPLENGGSSLPPRVKSAVFKRLKEVLEDGKDFPDMGETERRRITEILRRTVKEYE